MKEGRHLLRSESHFARIGMSLPFVKIWWPCSLSWGRLRAEGAETPSPKCPAIKPMRFAVHLTRQKSIQTTQSHVNRGHECHRSCSHCRSEDRGTYIRWTCQ